MCGCCRVTVDGKMRFACVEGPDFDGYRSISTSLSSETACIRSRRTTIKTTFAG
jgi:ferredoxin--NADP+ reductase